MARHHPQQHVPTPAEELRQLLEDVLHVSQQRLEEVEVRLHQSLGAINLRGARAMQIGTGGTTRPTTTSGTLLGYLNRESSGAVAKVNLRDGSDSSAPLLAPLVMAANGSANHWFGPSGISIQQGLFVETVTGAFEGVVFFRGPE